MVVGTKMTLQQVPSKGRISIRKIQNFTVHKRNSVIRSMYGVFMMFVSIVMISTNPLEFFTNKNWVDEEWQFIQEIGPLEERKPLRQLLELTTFGKSLLQKEENFLTPRERKALVQLIVEHQLRILPSIKDTIRQEVWSSWAKEICSQFKAEHPDIYYVPYRVTERQALPASGLLHNRLITHRRLLNLEGNSKRRSSSSNSSPSSGKSGVKRVRPLPFDSDNCPEEEDFDNIIEWLEGSSSPFDIVLKKWQASYKSREKIMKEKPIEDYFQQFPGLCLPAGHQLFLEVTEGSFVFRMWEAPPYQLYSEVWVYNYTNVAQFLSGEHKTLKLQEIGPFRFQESRTNRNMSIDAEHGTMFMRPNITLKFLREESIADIKDVYVYVPNMALLAISTLVADKLGYFANAGAYHSINMLGSKLFRNLTVEELFWGYEDPMVTIASGLLPGWIDFKKIGVLDRFYAQRPATAVVEIRNASSRFSLRSWDNSEGLVEQGFTNLNSSTLCNRITGSYEGLMLPPNVPKDRDIPIFRRQACRVYPFVFKEETNEKYGFNYYRFVMAQSAMSNTSEYACKCTVNCIPNGFVDVSKCYYGFPIALSKPHFLDTDPQQQSFYEGMHPDPKIHSSILEIEPTIGVPVSLSSKIQVNIAVRTSPGNPITKPFKDKIVPLLWLSLYCNEPPPEVANLLKLRFLVAPPLFISIEVLLLIVGLILCVQGSYRILKPKYELVETMPEKEGLERKKCTALVNMVDNCAFKDDDDLAKEAVLLLSVIEDDTDLVYRRDT